MRRLLRCLPALAAALGCVTSGAPVGDGIALPNGAVYRGELRDGVLHGRGRMEWPDGSFAEGAFRDGRLHGEAVWVSRSGARHEGRFEHGLAQGRGVRTWPAGDRYEGAFHLGLEHGEGTYRSSDGTVYTGEFADGQFHGQGVLRDAEGAVLYDGAWRKGRAHGRGTLHYADGRVYEGELRDDHPDGQGRMTHPDGAVYEGAFADGDYHGRGRYETAKGDVFDGEFVEGSFTGQGTWRHRDGEYHYEGAFVDWDFEGHGVWEATDGRRYEGAFADDRFEGEGRWEDPADGEVYEGAFEEGRYHGEGVLTWTTESGERRTARGVWSRGRYVRGDADELLPDPALEPEAVLFAQPERVERALEGVAPSRPGTPDLYFVGFAGWGDQGVFRREILFADRLLRASFGAEGRSVLLVNHPETRASAPLATASNLERVLLALGERMNPREDVLLLLLDSHGTPERLAVRLGDLPLTDLRPDMLRDMLDRSGIRWRVVVVSACYSGSFIEDLANEHTLVITAAAPDRRSFGCSDEAEFTEFGRAFLKEALPRATSLEEAFEQARARIAAREEAEERTPSDPRIAMGDAIRRHLARWRASLRGEDALTPAAVAEPTEAPPAL